MSGNLVHTFFGKKTCGTFFAFFLSPLFEVDAKKLDLNVFIHKGVSKASIEESLHSDWHCAS